VDPRLNSFGKILLAAALWSTIGLASVYSGNYVVPRPLQVARSCVVCSGIYADGE
jgi:hypothetical protein